MDDEAPEPRTRRSPGGRLAAKVARDARSPAAWPALDGVRGLGVLAAVSWHVIRLYPAADLSAAAVPVAYWPLGVQRFAVDAFFVLSGFLVVRSWETTRRHRCAWRAWWDFMARRAARILPAYWVSLAILVPVVAPALLYQPARLALFATLNQYVKFWLPGQVNVVYWSLTTEWHFYLLVPLVAWLLARVGHVPVLGASMVLSVVWYLHPPLRLPASFVFGRLDQFVAGAVLGGLVVAHRRGMRSRVVAAVQRRGAGVVTVGTLVALGTFHGSTFGMGRGRLLDALVHPLAGLLIAAGLLRVLTSERRTMLAHPVLRWFGTISYGLYLWHYPLLEHGRELTRIDTPMHAGAWSALVVVVLVAASVVLAVCSYVLVERPFMRRTATSRHLAPRAAGGHANPRLRSADARSTAA